MSPFGKKALYSAFIAAFVVAMTKSVYSFQPYLSSISNLPKVIFWQQLHSSVFTIIMLINLQFAAFLSFIYLEKKYFDKWCKLKLRYVPYPPTAATTVAR